MTGECTCDIGRRKRPMVAASTLPVEVWSQRRRCYKHGYALDLLTPTRHVVTELADGASLTADELVHAYRLYAGGDTSRIIGREPDVTNEVEAHRWLIDRAIGSLQPPLIEDAAGRYSLAVPAAEMTQDGDQIHVFANLYRDPTIDRGPMWERCICPVDPDTNQYVKWDRDCRWHYCADQLEPRPAVVAS